MESGMFRKHALRLAPALLSGLLATAAHAAPGDPLGPPLTLETGPDAFKRSTVARDAAGNFSLVYEEFAGTRQGVFLRRFDTSGHALGGAVELDDGQGDASLPAIAMSPNGNLVVLWQQGSSLYARRYSAAGAPLGGSLPVAQIAAGTVVNGRTVATDPDGDFVVAWDDTMVQKNSYIHLGGCTVPGVCLPLGYRRSHTDVFLRRFDASGNPGALVKIDSGETNTAALTLVGLGTLSLVGDPTVAMDAQGDYAIAWTAVNEVGVGIAPSGDDAGTATAIRLRRYNAQGTALEPVQKVDSQLRLPGATRLLDDVAEPRLAAAANGYTLMWLYKESVLHLQPFASRSTSRGSVISAPNAAGCAIPEEAAITSNAAGSVVATWMCDGFGGIEAYRVGANGAGLGGVIEVFRTADENAVREDTPAVANDAAGNFVVTWTQQMQDAAGDYNGELHGRLYTGP